MKIMKSLLLSSLFFLATAVFSQTINDAGNLFNQGIQSTKAGNTQAAIDAFTATINMCEELGPECDDLKAKSIKQLGSLYFKAGIDSYKAKDYNEAIKNFKMSSQYAAQSGDTETKAKADNYLAVFYSSFGMSSWKKDDFDKAIDYFNKAIEADPSYSKTYLGMALVYKSKENDDKMKQYIDKCIEIGAGDKYAEQAKDIAQKHFYSKAAKALQANNYPQAVEHLDTSLEYGTPDAATFYFYTLAYNGQAKWQQAIEAAEKALSMEMEDKSNLYFELGKAYEGAGNTEAACDAYKKVSGGDNLEVAKYKIEQELKCN